jgi:hypothetical protein
VTPERVAEHVADRVRAACEAQGGERFEYVVLDAFAGGFHLYSNIILMKNILVGGNAIQFALAGAFG